MFSKDAKQTIVELDVSDFSSKNIKLLLQRDELNDSYCMGNKWWKLKYNLIEAVEQGKQQILTFEELFLTILWLLLGLPNEWV